MQIESIGLEKLFAHRDNVNVMDVRHLAKLKGHLRETGRYEPLVVRVHPEREGCYELINGHHRKVVLAELGYDVVDCVVWELSDAEAWMLLATINRIGGQDDLAKRAKLLARLQDEIGDKELVKALPETRERLAKVLALNKPVVPVGPKALAAPLGAMTFFVSREQKGVIDQALKKMKPAAGGQRTDQLVAMGQWVLGHDIERARC